MFAGEVLVVVVTFALADGVVGDDHCTRAGVEHAGVIRVPTRFVCAVTVYDNDGGHLAFWGTGRTVDVRGNSQVVGSAIGDVLEDDSGGSGDRAVRLR